MAEYRISGVWIDDEDVITHYAFHEVFKNGVGRAVKYSKAKAIELLETKGNSATTWRWNYKTATWNTGKPVEVVKGASGKYLRSDPDDTTTNNLGHLINYDWILR